MDIESKIEIIVEFIHRYYDDRRFKTFFKLNDMGIPLSLAVNQNLCSLNSAGIEIIIQTYNSLCFELNIDNETIFETIEDFFDEV
jgi:hypothetical protein